MQRRFRIGTRGSKLALIQAHMVADLIGKAQGLPAEEAAEIVVIKTTGDLVQDRNLSELGGKGLFTKEIEDALANGGIDVAVHSMKDMPTLLPDGLIIDCLLERADPRDAFLSSKATSIATLPQGAVVGTSSLRRAAQIKARRPDVAIVPFRGNVDTRLKKLADGVADATLLAMAGLTRMGLLDCVTAPLSTEEILPAVAQGAIGIERRKSDDEAARVLSTFHHAETGLRVAAERALLAVLDGSCRTPIAALAEISGKKLSLRAMILTPDGAEVIETSRDGLASDAAALGADAGEELKSRAGPHFFTIG
jgi:hydroxymethylbilane synthase